jgi:methylase of polypeptide subunit release factors
LIHTDTRIHVTTYSLYAKLAALIRKSRMVHRVVFGFWPKSPGPGGSPLWDWTTLSLRSALHKYLKHSLSILDMGTGVNAVLALYSQRVLGASDVWASDVVPEIIKSAQAQARAEDTSITFMCSDLFAEIHRAFDIIIFNAPYLDSVKGEELGLLRTDLDIRRFSGGEGGGDVISRFIADAPKALTPDGRVILGVNHYHMSKSLLQELVCRSNLEIETVIEHSLTKSSAYVLRRKP